MLCIKGWPNVGIKLCTTLFVSEIYLDYIYHQLWVHHHILRPLTWGKSCSPSASPLPPSRSPSSSSKVSRLRAHRGQLSSSNRRGLGTTPASWYSSLWRPAGVWTGGVRHGKGASNCPCESWIIRFTCKQITIKKRKSEVWLVRFEKWGWSLSEIVLFYQLYSVRYLYLCYRNTDLYDSIHKISITRQEGNSKTTWYNKWFINYDKACRKWSKI